MSKCEFESSRAGNTGRLRRNYCEKRIKGSEAWLPILLTVMGGTIYSGREPLAGLLLSSDIVECASWSGGGAYVVLDQ